ncbi:hypothetical protein GRF29_1g2183734 [Pseudopithomyces chartarum]|uniref:Uncharacterized protein n=1 Tax=Pseudopithomyces chartarum TaxID=1892770 RepID=A0AAN6RLW0_9PLEO|nr:hypothetical protein GRF29_1g2183734 [Pseudopithomyces chartarum]
MTDQKTDPLYQREGHLHTHTSTLTSITPLSSLPPTLHPLFKPPKTNHPSSSPPPPRSSTPKAAANPPTQAA